MDIGIPVERSDAEHRVALAPAGVVTTRAHVHYVVTEYGVANLFGKSLRRRAELRGVARARNLID